MFQKRFKIGTSCASLTRNHGTYVVFSRFLTDNKNTIWSIQRFFGEHILQIYDTICNYNDCKLLHINHLKSCDAFLFSEYTLIQMNYNRLHDFDNYDKTIALPENYGELIIERIHISYISSALIVQTILCVK